MDLELYIVIAMIVVLFVTTMIDQYRKEKRQNSTTLSNENDAQRSNRFKEPNKDITEAKTKEIPVFANYYDNF